MSTPTIFETCRPRDDVLSGAMADADFAADLASVVAGTSSPAYHDPVRFFADTYPTEGAQDVAECFRRQPEYFLRVEGDSMNMLGFGTGWVVAVKAKSDAANWIPSCADEKGAQTGGHPHRNIGIQ